MIGKTLSHYEITGLLGKGGMGEVYRARDTRLGRDVAIKVLPESLAKNLEIRARFEREAKTISALNSPHICTLHDVGRDGEIDFLVMELVEGETLAQRLEKGALPLSETLTVGSQIADALDRAHRAGVIHRDLKPGNIMLTRGGAKLMDFGLARVAEPGGAEDGASVAPASQSPTIAHPLTAEGSIVGTFQYMAPEQLEGHAVDARADLWALGCVLYEMATGKRAFHGESQASLIGAIMHAEPPAPSSLAPMAPPELDRLVQACLVKDPEDRVQSAHDVKLQLEWLKAPSSPDAAARPLPPSRSRARSAWAGRGLAAVVAVLATALLMTLLRGGEESGERESLPQRYILGNVGMTPASAPAVSPDGRIVVVSGLAEAEPRLYRRDLGSMDFARIPGSEGGRAPFFSPDGAWIGFATEGALKKVPVGGGTAQLIANEVDATGGGCWAPDGWVYFSPRSGGADGVTALARVREGGGVVETVATLDSTSGEYEAWLPDVLPDGSGILLSIFSSGGGAEIVRVRPGGDRVKVLHGMFLGRYAKPGHLLYYDMDAEAVFGVQFDLAEARPIGSAIPLTEPVNPNYCYGISKAGHLVYVPQPGSGEGVQVVEVDRDGTSRVLSERRADWTQPRISPDGSKVLLRKVETNCELWILDIERSNMARIAHGADSHDAIWSPDGKKVIYQRRGNPIEMVTLSVSGARESKVIESGATAGSPQSWSAAGNLLAYTVLARGTGEDIWVRSMDEGGKAEVFLATKAQETSPAISPNGKWIAYASDDSGTEEVYLRTFPDQGSLWQVSAGGGRWPVWSKDGQELFYFRGRRLMVATVRTEPELEVSMPSEVPDLEFAINIGRDVDTTPDGNFIALRAGDSDRLSQQPRILVNWQAEMERVLAGR